jgi:hypothetical protein
MSLACTDAALNYSAENPSIGATLCTPALRPIFQPVHRTNAAPSHFHQNECVDWRIRVLERADKDARPRRFLQIRQLTAGAQKEALAAINGRTKCSK